MDQKEDPIQKKVYAQLTDGTKCDEHDENIPQELRLAEKSHYSAAATFSLALLLPARFRLHRLL